ncbi:MAG: Swt1 family HEPN domain-containing protein [Candidatus Daviesbacteria bacterium]|nr:Swt1 family HEPN domain-containing protein [Candidatus Daviesbacteria bacterium]
MEADLSKLEKSGIDIDHLKTLKSDSVVDVELFDTDILKSARKMADFYVLYYSLENTLRRIIEDRLKERHGASWWVDKVPTDVKTTAEQYMTKEKDTLLSSRTEDPLVYVNFADLIKIFESNWDDFSDTIRSRKAMGDTLYEFNRLRDVIAHSCELNEDDIKRFELLIKDWLRIQT